MPANYKDEEINVQKAAQEFKQKKFRSIRAAAEAYNCSRKRVAVTGVTPHRPKAECSRSWHMPRLEQAGLLKVLKLAKA